MQGGATSGFGLTTSQPPIKIKPPESENAPLGCVGILLVPVVLLVLALGIVFGLRPSKRQREAARQQQMQLAAHAEAQRQAAWYAEDMRRRQADAEQEQRWAAEAERRRAVEAAAAALRQVAEAAQQRQWAAEAEQRRTAQAEFEQRRDALEMQREAAEGERRRAAEAELEKLWAAEAEKRRLRHEQLTTRFDAATADRIVAGKIWQGQTREMLVEAFGTPRDVDEHVLKTKTKLVYKYFHQGANRYSLRVTLENGAVVSWDDKR